MMICLTMIVKDEAPVIARCLDAAIPLFDTWCIVDTGSTDGTQDLIREHLAGIPGQLHERPWKDFGHNRTEAIDLATDMADYLMFVDADDILVIPDGYQLPDLNADCYDLEFDHAGLRYRRICLVNTALPWRFVGVVHEYPECDRPVVPVPLDLVIRFGGDGNRSQAGAQEKYLRDAAMLEAALIEDPDNPRTVFYLAQSYRDAGASQAALTRYDLRTQMGGFDQEVYWSRLQAARLSRELGAEPMELIDRLLRAHDVGPSRPEALGDLAELCRLEGRWACALMFAERGLALPPCTDVLFVEQRWQKWQLLDEKAIAAYWLGDYDTSLEACDQLLASVSIPEEQVSRVQQNRQYARDMLVNRSA